VAALVARGPCPATGGVAAGPAVLVLFGHRRLAAPTGGRCSYRARIRAGRLPTPAGHSSSRPDSPPSCG
jgi:hypothetical protein